MPLLDSIGFWLLIAVCIAVGAALLPYVLAPILVFFATKIAARPELEEFYLEDPDVPRLVMDFVDDTLEDMERDGFAVLGAYYLGTLVANVRSFMILVGKRQTRDLAMIAVTYAEGGGVSSRQMHVEYSAVFADGSVDTNNMEELSAFLPAPGHVTHTFPWVRDARRLYRIHQALVARERPGQEKVWPVGDDPAAYLEANLAESLARQVPNGCLSPSGPKHYRLTVSTALRATYQNLWPFKGIAKARRRRRGEALLQTLRLTRDS
jgi:hypothetical protein